MSVLRRAEVEPERALERLVLGERDADVAL
jgi:hypothetical protein